MSKRLSIPLALFVSVIIALSGWLVNAQSKKDENQDCHIVENRKHTDIGLETKLDNKTFQMLLRMQEKNFERSWDEIKELRKEQRALIDKLPEK